MSTPLATAAAANATKATAERARTFFKVRCELLNLLIILPKPSILLPTFVQAVPTATSTGPAAANPNMTFDSFSTCSVGIPLTFSVSQSIALDNLSTTPSRTSPTGANFAPNVSNNVPTFPITSIYFCIRSSLSSIVGFNPKRVSAKVRNAVFKPSIAPDQLPFFRASAVPSIVYWNISLASSVHSSASVSVSNVSSAGKRPWLAISLTASVVVLYFVANISHTCKP